MNLLNNISFNNPELFFLLILPLMHVLWHFFSKNNTENVLSFSNTNFFSSKKSIRERLIYLPYLLQILSISLIILSLARPQTTNSWEETEGIDIIIAMDISGSMEMDNKLDAAKKIGIDFIKDRKNDRIGLVSFSGSSFTQCPLTTDYNSLINLFKDINPAKEMGILDGTHIGDGIGLAVNRLMHSASKSKVIILLTDGNDDGKGELTPIKSAYLAASDTAKVKIYTIAIGKDQRIKDYVLTNRGFRYIDTIISIDSNTLKSISEITGGKYYRATDSKSLKEIYNKIDKLEKTKLKKKQKNKKEEEFYLFLFIALGVFLLSFILKITYFRGIN